MKRTFSTVGIFGVFVLSIFFALFLKQSAPECYAEGLCDRIVTGSELQKRNVDSSLIPLDFLSIPALPLKKEAERSASPLAPLLLGEGNKKEESLFDPLSHDADIESSYVSLDIPFTSQAPSENWNPPFDEACEEASLLMVKSFLGGELISKESAEKQIQDLADWEKGHGFAIDIPIQKLAQVAEDYYSLKGKVYENDEVSSENIKKLLRSGYPVIVPAAGKKLGNPHFRGDGPPYHMLVIIGYDDGKDVFITNDPGTKHGASYGYNQDLLMNAIHDWTGSNKTIEEGERRMLVLESN